MNKQQQKLLALVAEIGVGRDKLRELVKTNSRRAHCKSVKCDFVELDEASFGGIGIRMRTSAGSKYVSLKLSDAERFANTILAEIRKAR